MSKEKKVCTYTAEEHCQYTVVFPAVYDNCCQHNCQYIAEAPRLGESSGSAEFTGSIPLQDVAEKVCEHLPEGYILHLCMENGAAWVSLTDNRNGCKIIDVDGADLTLYEQINEALCIAKGFKE